MSLMSVSKNSYANRGAVRRAFLAIEAAGASVSVVRLFPDGAIELMVGKANDNPEVSEFDRLEAAGCL